MLNFKTLLTVCALFFTTPAFASDLSLNVENDLNPRKMKRVESEEKELLYRQQEAYDDSEFFATQNRQSRTCWQRSKPYVITVGVLFAVCGTVAGGIIGWSEACLNLLANNGTSIFCSNNTNNTGFNFIPPWFGGIP